MHLSCGVLLKRGEYRIERVLGQGGFGITYLAMQTALDRKVAVKEFFMKELCERDAATSQVSVPSAGSRELVERFRQKFIKEARLIASLDNENIIKIYDVFEENGSAYYVMEYLEGCNLKTIVEENGALSEDVALKYTRQIASALSEVHSNNLLHLDVKPANIMLNRKGMAILIDFGISKHYDEGGVQTSSAGVGVSEGFAPLEQYEAGALNSFTPAVDVYALGATLFFMLKGERPPKASDVMNFGLPELPSSVSATVRDAVVSAMQPALRMRLANMDEFLTKLDAESTVYAQGSGRNGWEYGKSASPAYVHDDMTCIDMGNRQNFDSGWPVQESKASVSRDVNEQPLPKSKNNTSLIVGVLLLVVLSVCAGVFLLTEKESEDFLVVEESSFNDVPSGSINGHDYVDLGLSVRWATCNVGATSPEGYGNYYAWGETVEKSSCTSENYKWSHGTDHSMIKYCTNESFGYKDGKKTLELEDDVAYVKWGSSWRMPTSREQKELRENCIWELIEYRGVNGYKVTGPNGNSIFLPIAGSCRAYGVCEVGSRCDYWSSTLDSSCNDAHSLYVNNDKYAWNNPYRYYGHVVRPVAKNRY